MAPTLFIVPGLYEGPEAFESLANGLETDGFPVYTTQLVSTGTESPGNPTMEDDIAAIAADLGPVVEGAGPEGVVVVMHSAGGFLGSAAMRGLTAAARRRVGREGGVRAAIFLAAGIAPEGMEHQPLPFMQFDEEKGYQTCKDTLNLLFHDLPPEEAQSWAARMRHQPAKWDGTITYCGWREMPSVYIACLQDKLIPSEKQEQFAQLAGSHLITIDAGHMAQLSNPDETLRLVKLATHGLIAHLEGNS